MCVLAHFFLTLSSLALSFVSYKFAERLKEWL